MISINKAPRSIACVWQTERRYYKLFLYQDLLGHWVLLRIWGGLHNNRHGKKQSLFETFEAGMTCVEQVAKMRKQRGYRVSNQNKSGNDLSNISRDII